MSFLKTKIRRLLCDDIEVYIREGHFEFRRGRHVKLFEPFIYLPNEPEPEIDNQSSGDSVAKSHTVIEPFSGEDIGHPDISRREAIEAFVARGFEAVTKRMYWMPPDVYFHGVKRLEKAIEGFDRSILSDAAEAAGARNCIFVENKD